MADQKGKGITWTDQTWNPLRGCTVVSEGCRNCYAMSVAARFNQPGQAYEGLAYRNSSGAHWTGKVNFVEEHLKDPLHWQRPRRVFVNSMSDLFHESVPDSWIDQIFAVMAMAPKHTFQVLTKRPERMRDYMFNLQRVANAHAPKAIELRFAPSDVLNLRMLAYSGVPGGRFGRSFTAAWPLPNVWLGTSVEDQKTADQRIHFLLETPAAVRWLSAEPLLGPLDLDPFLPWEAATQAKGLPFPLSSAIANLSDVSGLNWVVVGGESGDGARPMHPDWARLLRDQCVEAKVPFFFKQWGRWLGGDGNGQSPAVWQDGNHGVHPLADRDSIEYFKFGPLGEPGCFALSVGKKAAGDLLDGREWKQYPEVATA